MVISDCISDCISDPIRLAIYEAETPTSEGYIIDESGNYIVDESGNKIIA